MNNTTQKSSVEMPSGVILNAYPDSLGATLKDAIKLLKNPLFKDVFSMFYILPTMFNSDLDRGFSIIDYHLNQDLVTPEDLEALKELGVGLKLDIVLNHLSVNSPQFQDLLKKGNTSIFKDFFLDWNAFWKGHSQETKAGIVVPQEDYLNRLFMRKPGLPVLKVPLPDGSEKVYWNTFYQEIIYHPISKSDLNELNLTEAQQKHIAKRINAAIVKGEDPTTLPFDLNDTLQKELIRIVKQKCTFLGQMDVNAQSPLVWEFYEETLKKLSDYGCRLLRLDAFAYLHKEAGQTNFFNIPGTWDYLDRIKEIADRNQMAILPEIHAEYGAHLHDQIAAAGHAIYDFFFPGLVLHTLENADNRALLGWIHEIVEKEFQTVNMLGCHDGIPVLDLNGKEVNGIYSEGLLSTKQIDLIMDRVLDRGGRVKNIYDAEGNKLSYYQINATFFSALGEDEAKMLLARALQIFMPGIPQVWYLDLFVGKNDYAAANSAGKGGHKEINRTNLVRPKIEEALGSKIVQQQLELLRLRNTHPAFEGELKIRTAPENQLCLEWQKEGYIARLEADLITFQFRIQYTANKTLRTIKNECLAH